MDKTTTRQFLARLWVLQGERGVTDSQLSRLLGVTPSYVCRLKTGERGSQIGLRVALAAIREWPELTVFLTRDLPTIKPDQTEGKTMRSAS